MRECTPDSDEALLYQISPRQIIPAKITVKDPIQSQSVHVDSSTYNIQETPTYTYTTQGTPAEHLSKSQLYI